MKVINKLLIISLSSFFIISCSKGTASFSLLSSQENFTQGSGDVQNTKIDILWVIDNSGSMATSQSALISNFQDFIGNFKQKNYDFQMAVVSTDAYLGLYNHHSSSFDFKDGSNQFGHSGVPIVTSTTPDFDNIFLTNVHLGDQGSGDERAFQSFKESLNANLNSGFLRPDAFLSIIIVSDEDDFSHDSQVFTENYNDPDLHNVQSFVDYLDGITNSNNTNRKYSVSALAIFDETCRQSLTDSFSGRKIAYRYAQLVDATSGIKGSLCENFSQQLNFISDNIIQLATQFHLTRLPKEDSIKVYINGSLVPKVSDIENPSNGWVYLSDTNSIRFFGTAIPPQNASIKIDFDPVGVGI